MVPGQGGVVGTTSVGDLRRCIDTGARAREAATPSNLPDAIAVAAARLADAACRGGRLLVCGKPTTAPDVDHLVVEFVHPVNTGARSVAAVACRAMDDGAVARWIDDVARPSDVVVAVAESSRDSVIAAAVMAARRAGASVVTLANDGDADVVVGTLEGIAAKELRVVAYHVLWELVQMSCSGHEAGEATS
jgi:D-sedoheptulose 7-phosphate isomerase